MGTRMSATGYHLSRVRVIWAIIGHPIDVLIFLTSGINKWICHSNIKCLWLR